MEKKKDTVHIESASAESATRLGSTLSRSSVASIVFLLELRRTFRTISS